MADSRKPKAESSFFMNQLIAITKNTYLQTIRQPLYGIIVLVTLASLALSPSLAGWTLDDDNKMLRDIGLSTLLIQGLFLGCFAASSVLNAEIDDKTVLTAVAKPISRPLFILGKYLGLFASLITAHYLASIAFFMSMRHGVLQTAAETFDLTVIVLGPGVMLVLVIASTVLNYVYDWRFLPTVIVLSLPFLTLSSAILLAVDRDWKLQTYEIAQTMENLPPEVVGDNKLRGIITFRPIEGDQQLAGHSGHLVRKFWQGPISEEEEKYLQGLSDSIQWKKDVNFLAQDARKLQGLEIFKAIVLILVALAVLSSIAVAASTRLGMLSTLLICLLALAAGLSADQVIRPLAEGPTAKVWAEVLYRVVPSFQCFWMVDALSENRVIPWGFVASAAGYGVLYAAAGLLLAMALFETREVG
ncbi:MAG: ABC transporter permease [Phycisphaerae bacterium]|nr:ABC transporter permease [Phycisphaerae bacterium]